MVETSDKIAAHIQNTRNELRSNLNELGDKVRSATDWRHHYNNSPWVMIAIAAGGGLLLSLMMGGRKRTTLASAITYPAEPPDITSRFSGGKNLLQKHFSDITAALIGLVATQTKEFINKLIPNFGQHLPPNR